MLQFLVGDHLQGYGLPSLRTKVITYTYGEVYINEDGTVTNYYRPRSETFPLAVALRKFHGCTEVLYEDGSCSFYGIHNKEGVDQRYNYLLV
jgi:hypothetical protein